MPLVQNFRGARILKAKRARALRGRPAWQVVVPESPELRDGYAIAAKYESEFSRAFLGAVREMITPEIERDIQRAWRSGDPAKVLAAIPYFGIEADADVWAKFTSRLSVAYLSVIQASGDAATGDLNKALGTDLVFTALPPDAPPPDEAIAKSMEDVRRAAEGLTVGVNPYSIKWVNERGLDLVKQSITEQQRRVVSDMIENAMAEGVRPTELAKRIKASIGLTAREHNAVLNREDLLESQGYEPREVAAISSAYREKLLVKRAKRIARTETIAAQSQGRRAAWLTAQDSGKLPAVRRRWIARAPSDNPNAPCEICLALDGTTATLDGEYESIYGTFAGPPAHPQCSCTEALERA